MSRLHQIGILPALLIILGGLLVLRNAEDEKAQRRFTLYLLAVGAVLLLAVYVAIRLATPQDRRLFWQVSTVLTPSIIGVLALIVLQAKRLAVMGRRSKLLALLLGLGLAGMAIGYRNTRFDQVYFIVPGVAVLSIGWAAGRRFRKIAVPAAGLLLLALFGLNNLINRPPGGEPSPLIRSLGLLFQVALTALPGLVVVGAAVLLTNSLQARRGKRALLQAALALALLGTLAHLIFWASVWDQTSDGLGGLFLSRPSALVAVGAGMAMAVALNGRRRAAGLLFSVVVPLLLYQSFELGWQVSYHEMTERRAERIAQALADYRENEGTYPPALEALTPRYLLRVPQPVELQGEPWCYQGGDEFYRLGAFSREFFSMPVKLQVYQAVGQPDSVWACEEQVAEMKERYYSPMEDPDALQPPLPTPLPSSDEAVEAETLAPLVEEGSAVWGSWSPDGAYFLLGQGDASDSVTLSFLEGESGERCAVDGTFAFPPLTVNLRQQHAWLADGRLLLVDDSGQVVLLPPCASGAQIVTPESAETFTEILAYDAESGRALFKSANAFWIFDGQTLSWQPVSEAMPTPYEAHWDNAAWQPGGQLLAISRLNGRDADEGSTLYLVDGDSGEVSRSLSLEAASRQSAPGVEWLSSQELLLMSSGVLRILDLGSDPPVSRDVIGDILGLDLDFPHEVGGHGWEVDRESDSYILTLQANHPRNQALYVYRSDTGAVNTYEEEANVLLLFPGGQMQQWAKLEAVPPEPPDEDEFVTVDLEDGSVSPPLAIAGHTPRDYARLSMAYLPASGQLAVASSQGVSLHSLPNGEMMAFWTLAEEGFAPFLRPAPDGSALVAIQDRGGVYWIPLP